MEFYFSINVLFFLVQVHPWVNFESILKKCYVGRLSNTVDENIFDIPSSSKKNNIKNISNDLKCLKVSKDGKKLDWYQQQNFITLVLYLKDRPTTVSN